MMHPWRKRCAGALVVLALLVPCGAVSGAALIEGVVKSLLLAELPRLLGPADRYDAEVLGASDDGSHYDEVRVTGARVARPGNPVIDTLQANLKDVQVDVDRRQLQTIGDARAEVRLRAADLAAFLRRQGWVQGASVTFTGRDSVVVRGRPSVAGLTTAAALGETEFRGRLLPHGSQLRLTVDAVRIAGFEATDLSRGVLEASINPLFDTAAYAVPSHIDSVEVQGGDTLVIAASGSELRPAEAPAPQPGRPAR